MSDERADEHESKASPDAPDRGRSRRRRRGILIVTAVLLVLGAYSAFRLYRAAAAGRDGKDALLAAEDRLQARDLDGARQQLAIARRAFERASHEVDGLGPIAPLARVTPLVRVQLQAVETYADVGSALAGAGDRLTDAAAGVIDPPDEHLAVADALDALTDIRRAVADGRADLERAAAEVEDLEGLRLFGPLADARDDLLDRLPPIRDQAASLDTGLGALLSFAGADGPRRYLLFSQNPDEPRPTGGFIGSYGVLVVEDEGMDIERYEGLESWTPPLPPPVVSVDDAPAPFRVPEKPVPQTIWNVNATADFPPGGRLASEMWAQAGERPVDGVISFIPEVLVRVLEVLGPVEVTSFGETVTAANLLERLDFHTHPIDVVEGTDRKEFLGVLSEAVWERLLEALATRWEALAEALGSAFEARELMVWSSDDAVQDALAERGWHGTLPETRGDFGYAPEFAYTTKAGRGLRRTFEHRVELVADGSARTTTVITIANTLPASDAGKPNFDSLSYIFVYGPEGAVLDESASDPIFDFAEPIADHPGAGWVKYALPLDETAFTVVWDAPRAALRRVDGTWEYRLSWWRMPGTHDDVLHLDVELPPGWRWDGPAPPATVKLGEDFAGSWVIVAESG